MASSFTTRLRLEKQGTGDNTDTWGTVLNGNMIDLADEAFGHTSITATSTTYTLTTNNGSSDDARHLSLTFTGTPTGNLTVNLPSGIDKVYRVDNDLGGSLSLTAQAGTGNSITVDNGQSRLFMIDGSDNASDVVTQVDKLVVDNTATIETLNVTSTATCATLTVTSQATIAGLDYPTSDGSANQFLQTDGAGTLSFASPSDLNNKVGVTTNDATPDFLNSKLTVGVGLTTAVANASADEELNITLDDNLEDIAGLAVTNGSIIVGDGSGFVLESGQTARTSLNAVRSATSASDNALARFDGSGDALQSTGIIIDDNDNVNFNGAQLTNSDTPEAFFFAVAF